MRTNDDEASWGAWYLGDNPDGSTRIRCDACGRDWDDYTEPDEPSVCPSCGEENWYRSWLEW